jgi:CRISPR-associated exonuclease Cas4
MYSEDSLLPISALQHLLFCERQCALIHLEGLWLDNALTVEGSHLHRQADAGAVEARGDVVVVRALPLRSLRLGITGRADVVEFLRCSSHDEASTLLPGRTGRWGVRPVEYKRGRPKQHRADEVQLCAQALCLEEMMHVSVASGDLFYGARRRRTEVLFDANLRGLTEHTITRLRSLLASGGTPPARFEQKCKSCSLMPACLPKASSRVQAYLAQELRSGGRM